MFSGFWISILCLCLAVVPGATTNEPRLNITHMQFTPGTIYSTDSLYQYTNVIVDFEVMNAPIPMTTDGTNTGSHILVRFSLPHREDGTLLDMTVGINQQGGFVRFPGDDLYSKYGQDNWAPYNTNQYPLIGTFVAKYYIQALVNTSQTYSSDYPALPQGYVGRLEVSDVLVPQSCQFPGVYTLSIGSVTTTHRPNHNGVLCPELKDLTVSFNGQSSLEYDTTNVSVTFNFTVGEYAWYDNGQDVEVIFPGNTYPAHYVIEDDGTLILGGMHNWTEVVADKNVSQGLLTMGSLARPTYGSTTTGGGVVPAGSALSITLTGITLPWNCEYNQTFCVRLEWFSTCVVIEEPVMGCPVLTLTQAALSTPLYGSTGSNLTLTINTSDYVLWEKPKYEVKISFPEYVAELFTPWGASSASIEGLPDAEIYGHPNFNGFAFRASPSTPSVVGTDNPPPGLSMASFFLDGTNNYEPFSDGQQRHTRLGVETTFILGNISVAGNCIPGRFRVEIGPFFAELETTIVDGCPTLANLNLSFVDGIQGNSVTAMLEFDILENPLQPEPMQLTIPYYSGDSRTFNVQCPGCSPALAGAWYIDGQYLPTLTLQRGITYTWSVCDLAVQPGLDTDCLSVALLGIVDLAAPNTVVAGGVVGTGTFSWTVPMDAALGTSYRYVNAADTTDAGEWGEIVIVERPRGLIFQDLSSSVPGVAPYGTRFTSALGNVYPASGTPTVFGELFATELSGSPWQSLSAPQGTGNATANTYVYDFFQTINAGATPVPTGKAVILIEDLQLPNNCENLGNVTLKFGNWEVTSDPGADTVLCPTLANLSVTFDSLTIGESLTSAYITFDLADAPLDPAEITSVTVAFPNDRYNRWAVNNPTSYPKLFLPYSDVTYASTQNPSVSVQNFNFGTTTYGTNATEIWVTANVTGGSVIPAGSTQVLVHVQGLQNFGSDSSACGLLMADQNTNKPYYVTFERTDGTVWQISGYPGTDALSCPELTSFDVEFVTANQSATSDVVISVGLSDYLDPREIRISVPLEVDVSGATVASIFANASAGWTPVSTTTTFAGTHNEIAIQVAPRTHLTTTPRTPYVGTAQIVLSGFVLPRANCSDLGMWSFAYGNTYILSKSWFNPNSDTVTSCTSLSNLDVTLSPDGEQGQVRDVTVSFDISDHQLSYWPGDSDYIRVVLPPTLGLSFTAQSYFTDTINGWTWTAQPIIQSGEIRQSFTGGDSVPYGARASFTIKNVQLPDTCVPSTPWLIEIGIWTLYMEPSTTDLVLCPELTNLEVEWVDPTHCQEEASAVVSFDLSVVRLRPGWLKLYFPPESDIVVWPRSTVTTGPGDWSTIGTSKVVPLYPVFRREGYIINQPMGEVSFMQLFQGTPLEPGNYSFTITGLATPCNNCTELGDYKLSVGKWASNYTNPSLDTLLCPGVIHRMNITVDPVTVGRRGNASYQFEFMVPECGFNQIDLIFEDGFTLGKYAPVDVTGLQNVDLTYAEVYVTGNTVSIFNVTNACQFGTSYMLILKVNNVVAPNHCRAPLFKVITRDCSYAERTAGHASPAKLCDPGYWSEGQDTYGIKSELQAAATGCGLCNACYWDFDDALGQQVYLCDQDGIQFHRVAVDGAGSCTETQTMSPNLF